MSRGPEIPGHSCVEHLGSGGFADVYLYEQQWPRQRVAVKVVRPDVPLTTREKQLFADEADAMARLGDHPYIVSVLTAGTTDGRPYLVMRYCPPPDLGVRVRSQPMSVVDAVSVGVKIASAVETAHRSGIVHRDIKPSNVLVTSYHEPALTDFGIAGRLHEVAGDDELRISYPWSPPELVDGRSNGSVSSDVYSLGATIWNLLVGRSPFAVPGGDNSTRALTARILHAAPPLTHRPDVPAALDRLLQQCLAKDPAHRPESAMALARALQRIEADAGFARTRIAVEGDPAGRQPGGPASNRASDPANDLSGGPAGHPDATAVKPISVIPEAGPRASQGESGRRGPGAADAPESAGQLGGGAPPQHRSAILWTVAAVALAVVVTIAAVLGTRGDDDPPAAPTPSTPLPLAPPSATASLGTPEVSGQRRGARVVFTWRAGRTSRAGDSWEWRRVDTGQGRRTAERRLVLADVDGDVCLQVRQIRGGDASPWGEGCLE